MTEKYKLMTYFVVATLHFYRDSIKPDTSVVGFIGLNKDVLSAVVTEAHTYFNYELSGNQIEAGVKCYIMESTELLTI